MNTTKIKVVGICVIVLVILGGLLIEAFMVNKYKADAKVLYAHCLENAAATDTDPENCMKILQ